MFEPQRFESGTTQSHMKAVGLGDHCNNEIEPVFLLTCHQFNVYVQRNYACDGNESVAVIIELIEPYLIFWLFSSIITLLDLVTLGYTS